MLMPKTGRQMNKDKQLGFRVECNLGQKKSRNRMVREVEEKAYKRKRIEGSIVGTKSV
jgi:hypothetical protein